VLYVYNVANWSHSKKQVRDALDEAYATDFGICATPAGHQWGYVECGKCGQKFSVWSTPKSPDNHAKQIMRFLKKHCHDDEAREEQ
jgi:hypothetical protein